MDPETHLENPEVSHKVMVPLGTNCGSCAPSFVQAGAQQQGVCCLSGTHHRPEACFRSSIPHKFRLQVELALCEVKQLEG